MTLEQESSSLGLEPESGAGELCRGITRLGASAQPAHAPQHATFSESFPERSSDKSDPDQMGRREQERGAVRASALLRCQGLSGASHQYGGGAGGTTVGRGQHSRSVQRK